MYCSRTTAYGSRQTVPGKINILVAGSSCVDFSLLNPKRKSLQDVGESGDTLRAILDYAKQYRPAIIILENVKKAPWEEIKHIWENNQTWLKAHGFLVNYWQNEPAYVAMMTHVDTKKYYIPQTRNRGYMILVDSKRLHRMGETTASGKLMTQHWADTFEDLKRPASCSVEDFLLPDDDRRVHNALIQKSKMSQKTREENQWVLCELRHVSYRANKGLGTGRPLTKWVNKGTAKAPDYWHQPHMKVQVERIWDTMDMAYLRSAVYHHYDVLWKL